MTLLSDMILKQKNQVVKIIYSIASNIANNMLRKYKKSKEEKKTIKS